MQIIEKEVIEYIVTVWYENTIDDLDVSFIWENEKDEDGNDIFAVAFKKIPSNGIKSLVDIKYSEYISWLKDKKDERIKKIEQILKLKNG